LVESQATHVGLGRQGGREGGREGGRGGESLKKINLLTSFRVGGSRTETRERGRRGRKGGMEERRGESE